MKRKVNAIWNGDGANGKGFLTLDNNIKISGVWRQGKIQKIDNIKDLEKINNDHSLLEFPIENEMLKNDFYLNIKYITPAIENAKEIYFDEDNGKIQYVKALKLLKNGFKDKLIKDVEQNDIL